MSKKLPKKSNAPVIGFIRQMIAARDSQAEVQRLLAEYEITADRDLSTSKLLL